MAEITVTKAISTPETATVKEKPAAMPDRFTTIDRLKLKKAKEKWLERWRRVRAEERKIRKLWGAIYATARDVKQRYGIDLKVEVKGFARELKKYRRLHRFTPAAIGDPQFPKHLADLYEYCKEPISTWNANDLREFKHEFGRLWKLTGEECVAKLIVELAREYKLLYEWAMSIPNGFVHILTDEGVTRIPESQILWTNKNGRLVPL